MSNTPKIMVFKLKELIYTGIFILLGLLLIIFLIKMFNSDKSENSTPNTQSTEITNNTTYDTDTTTNNITTELNTNTETPMNSDSNNSNNKNSTPNNANTETPNVTTTHNYSPGVYTSSLVLNNSALEVEVCVDLNRINSISINNMDESITTMYPLMSNSIDDLEKQIVNSQSLENITYSAENRYTYMVLLDAISHALSKAET